MTPTTTHTALIVPALTDIGGQCRIVMAEGNRSQALSDYRQHPDAWREVGLMDAEGRLVCCDDLGNLRSELKACEPLAAGLQLRISALSRTTGARP